MGLRASNRSQARFDFRDGAIGQSPIRLNRQAILPAPANNLY